MSRSALMSWAAEFHRSDSHCSIDVTGARNITSRITLPPIAVLLEAKKFMDSLLSG